MACDVAAGGYGDRDLRVAAGARRGDALWSTRPMARVEETAGGALVDASAPSAFVHWHCMSATPEVEILTEGRTRPTARWDDADTVAFGRRKEKVNCTICGKKGKHTPVQCAAKNCSRGAHLVCAHEAGLLPAPWQCEPELDQWEYYCKTHAPARKYEEPTAEVLRQRHTQLLKLAKEPNKARFVQELTASKAGQFHVSSPPPPRAEPRCARARRRALRRPLPPLEHQRPCERSRRFAADDRA